jgi:hypothetical protein
MDDLHRIFGELPAEPDATTVPEEMPVASRSADTSRLEAAPYTIDEAIADSIEQLTGESFPDPFTADHEIQYWIWTGTRLVPTSPEAAERLHQQELLEREERRRRRERRQAARGQRLEATRRLAKYLVDPLLSLVERGRTAGQALLSKLDML